MWQSKYMFPNTIGAIDCTHILLKKPTLHGDEYVNRKGLCSINVQATCDAYGRFTSVDCSWPGSVHDSRIWRNSDCYQIMANNDVNAILLGDDGYGLAPWLMTPFRNPTTNAQRAYNRLHKTERVIIEHTFGQVKQRFPILMNKIRMSTERIPSMIAACFILHNVAKYLNDPNFEEEEEEQNVLEIPDHIVNDANVVRRSQNIRNHLANTILAFP